MKRDSAGRGREWGGIGRGEKGEGQRERIGEPEGKVGGGARHVNHIVSDIWQLLLINADNQERTPCNGLTNENNK